MRLWCPCGAGIVECRSFLAEKAVCSYEEQVFTRKKRWVLRPRVMGAAVVFLVFDTVATFAISTLGVELSPEASAKLAFTGEYLDLCGLCLFFAYSFDRSSLELGLFVEASVILVPACLLTFIAYLLWIGGLACLLVRRIVGGVDLSSRFWHLSLTGHASGNGEFMQETVVRV